MTRQQKKKQIFQALNGLLGDALHGGKVGFLWEGVVNAKTEEQMRKATQEIREEFQRRST